MDGYAASMRGKPSPTDEDFDDANTLDLPYSLSTCLALWMAWRDHGVMAVTGGYLDQPRAWRRMIQVLNSYYARVSSTTDNDNALDAFGVGDSGYSMEDLTHG